MLISDEPHRASHKRRQQVCDIEGIDDSVQRTSSRATCLLVWLCGESKGDQDGENGHFAGKQE
jgi:hypothetical protein